MPIKKLKVGLVGSGKMGSLHLEKLLNEPSVSLIGIFDADPAQAARTTHKFRVRSYPSLTELFFEADAVFIASPTISHYIVAKQALESGVHVFVEKPICDTPEASRELVELAKRQGLVLQTGFVERYRLLKALREVKLGRPLLIEADRYSTIPSRESGMDVVTDLMIHDVDLVLWLLREPPSLISGVGTASGISEIDVANARLEFPSGAVANLNANWISPERHRKITIFSENGCTVVDLLSNSLEVFDRDSKNPLVKTEVALPAMDALQEQCSAFVRAVLQGDAPLVSGEDGVKALEVSLLIRERIRERRRAREFHITEAKDQPQILPEAEVKG